MATYDDFIKELEEEYYDYYDGLSEINLQGAIYGVKANIKHLGGNLQHPWSKHILKQMERKLQFLERIYNRNYKE